MERETIYRPADGGKALRAEADCSASARVLRLSDIDLHRTPVLRWRWRVEQGLDIADERTREGDDFAARVSVLFPFEPGRASWLERLRRGIEQRILDRELPGSALYFVWTAHVAPGTLWVNPYAPEVMTWAVREGPAEGWHDEAVDVIQRYREAFGRPPPRPVGVGIMTDADNSCSRAVALYEDIRFTPAEGSPPSSPPPSASSSRTTSP